MILLPTTIKAKAFGRASGSEKSSRYFSPPSMVVHGTCMRQSRRAVDDLSSLLLLEKLPAAPAWRWYRSFVGISGHQLMLSKYHPGGISAKVKVAHKPSACMLESDHLHRGWVVTCGLLACWARRRKTERSTAGILPSVLCILSGMARWPDDHGVDTKHGRAGPVRQSGRKPMI